MSGSSSGSGLELFGTGMIMGIVHVLTGPDHLSALATLSGTNIARHHALLSDHDHDHDSAYVDERDYNSANNIIYNQSMLGRLCLRYICNKNNSRYQAFLLGIRWGIGHSIGLLLVGGTLIALEQSSNDEWIYMDDTLTAVLESFVGVFMLVVGVYGLCKAFRNREENATLVAGEEYEYDDDLEMDVDASATLRVTTVTTNHIEMSYPERDGTYRQNLDDSGRSQRSHHEHLEDIISQMERHLTQDESSIYGGNRSHSLDISERVSISTQRMSVQTDQNEEFFGDALRNSMRSADGTVMTIPLDALLMDQQQQPNQQPQHHQQIQQKSDRKSYRKSSVSRQNSRDFNSSIRSDVNDNTTTSSAPLGRLASFAVPQQDGNHHHHHYHYHQIFHKCCYFCTPGTLALATGIVHGVAGPGGVLGVIPAVQLKEARLALLYLGTFCMTSTLVMGGFAAFYGTMSEWMAGVGESNGGGSGAGSRIFQVELGSSCLSIIVGIVWLTLLSMGKLEEVFP